MWQFSCWKLGRFFFSHWSSEISQLCTLALFYFYPLCGTLGGEFSLPEPFSPLRKISWITLMNLFSFRFTLSLSRLFFLLKKLFEHWASWTPFKKISPSLFSYLFWRGRGADFLNSSNPAIEFLISTLPKTFFVPFYSIWLPYLFVCFWGYLMIANGTERFINKVIWMLGKQNNCCGGWIKRRASEEGARWEGRARKKKGERCNWQSDGLWRQCWVKSFKGNLAWFCAMQFPLCMLPKRS